MISNKKTAHIIFFFVTICLIAFSACDDERFSTDSKYRLDFSKDTLSFDTVFKTLGSATSKILVYNRNNVALKISSIGIENGNNSYFKINVDGSKNEINQFQDIEISANDSLFIFVSVTIDTKNTKSVVTIEDSIMFITNGVKQKIRLEACGQEVVKLNGVRYNENTILTSDKPYLIYDSLIISKDKTLTLNPGCKLYFHNNANLIVYGNLVAKGTYKEPITMRGDRLDKIKFETPFPYNNVAGQWGGVFLLNKYGNHELDHVNINSGYVGIYFFNNDREIIPNLRISNCKIHNSLLYGMIAQNGNVIVTNTEISNSSSYTVYLNGGEHIFYQSTIANYFNNSNVQPVSRDKKPALMIMNLNRIAPMKTLFKNCIITGSSENEFSLATRFEKLYNGTFENCYIRTAKALTLPQFTNKTIRWFAKNDTLFKSTTYDYEKNTYFNFNLDSISPARKIGVADPNIAKKYNLEYDLNGNIRNVNANDFTDAGAYEWIPTR
jgi:hypothetical protein